MKPFKEFFTKKSIFDYLLFTPEGDALDIANYIAALDSDPDFVYRGVSSAEYKNLQKNGRVVSKGVGFEDTFSESLNKCSKYEVE